MNLDLLYTRFLECSSISIDTRKIDENAMFVAIKGANFDANTFALEALNKGAKYVIIDNHEYYIDSRTLLVPNCLIFLQDLASYHRKILNIPVIALTGSNGKTTTKELLNAVLSKKFKTKATIGNLNNHIGVPLTLLSFTKETEIGIVEMGANHQNEIAFLCQIAKPDFGYITNFGKAHLEGFGGIDGVIKGKTELYNFISIHNKTLFVNLDDSIQVKKALNATIIGFSQLDINGFLYFSNISASPNVQVQFNSTVVQSNLIGMYNATNICAAITIGSYFKVPDEQIKYAIESYFPSNNRSQIVFRDSNKILLDAYNANPSSMNAAIANFVQLEGVNKIMILGDMFELGSESRDEHKKIVEQIEFCCIKTYFVGNKFFEVKKNTSLLYFFPDYESFELEMSKLKLKETLFLIKGSRGMALERVLNCL